MAADVDQAKTLSIVLTDATTTETYTKTMRGTRSYLYNSRETESGAGGRIAQRVDDA